MQRIEGSKIASTHVLLSKRRGLVDNWLCTQYHITTRLLFAQISFIINSPELPGHCISNSIPSLSLRSAFQFSSSCLIIASQLGITYFSSFLDSSRFPLQVSQARQAEPHKAESIDPEPLKL